MKKNVLRVVIAVIVVIFTFSTGLWVGISFDSFKKYVFKLFKSYKKCIDV